MKKLNKKWLLWSIFIIAVCILGASLLNYYVYKKQSTNVNKSTNSKQDLEWVKNNSYFTINMKINGNDYEIFLVGEGERKSELIEENEIGMKDDTIIKGNFSFYLWKEANGKYAYKQEVELPNPMTFNLSKKSTSTYMVNQQNIAAIFQDLGEKDVLTYFYTIEKGKVVNLTDNGLHLLSRNIKSIQQNYLQTISKQENPKVNFDTWMLQKENMKLTTMDTTTVQSEETIENWLNKEDYYYPFKDITITTSMLTLAKQGMLIGSQYPIGTNVKEITKINADYINEETRNKENQLKYSDVTYLYDKKTGLVTSIWIPGVRFKERIQSLEKILGKPESFISKENGYLVIYKASKYQLQFQLDDSLVITSVQLKKN